MYKVLLDEPEGVAVARVRGGSSSADHATGAVRAMVALDAAVCRHPFPRVSLIMIGDDAEHFGPSERDRIIEANRSIRHRTIRLLVTGSGLHAASVGVMKQRAAEGTNTGYGTFRSVEAAVAFCEGERPGLDRVVQRLLARLDEPMPSGALKPAREPSTPPPARR